jgi:hypothetical protein
LQVSHCEFTFRTQLYKDNNPRKIKQKPKTKIKLLIKKKQTIRLRKKVGVSNLTTSAEEYSIETTFDGVFLLEGKNQFKFKLFLMVFFFFLNEGE